MGSSTTVTSRKTMDPSRGTLTTVLFLSEYVGPRQMGVLMEPAQELHRSSSPSLLQFKHQDSRIPRRLVSAAFRWRCVSPNIPVGQLITVSDHILDTRRGYAIGCSILRNPLYLILQSCRTQTNRFLRA